MVIIQLNCNFELVITIHHLYANLLLTGPLYTQNMDTNIPLGILGYYVRVIYS